MSGRTGKDGRLLWNVFYNRLDSRLVMPTGYVTVRYKHFTTAKECELDALRFFGPSFTGWLSVLPVYETGTAVRTEYVGRWHLHGV